MSSSGRAAPVPKPEKPPPSVTLTPETPAPHASHRRRPDDRRAPTDDAVHWLLGGADAGPGAGPSIQRQPIDTGYGDIVAAARVERSDDPVEQHAYSRTASPEMLVQLQLTPAATDTGYGDLVAVTKTPLPSKLTVGRPDDPLEQQADSIADAVLRMPYPSEPAVPGRIAAPRQVQQIPALQTGTGSGAPHDARVAPPIIERALRSDVGVPLDTGTQAFFGTRFGYDFSPVRVRTGNVAQKSCEALGARAYTVGEDIVFGGTFNPSAGADRKLLAHELAHVVQQSGNLGPLVQGSWYDDLKEVAYNKLIQGLREAKRAALAPLRSRLASLPESSRGSIGTIIEIADVVIDLVISLISGVVGIVVGFGEGIVALIEGLVKLVYGVIKYLVFLLGGFIDGGEKFTQYHNEIVAAVSNLIPGLKALVNDWIEKFKKAPMERQSIMIGELTGQVLALIATAGVAAAKVGQLPKLAVVIPVVQPGGAMALVGVEVSTAPLAMAAIGGSGGAALSEKAQQATEKAKEKASEPGKEEPKPKEAATTTKTPGGRELTTHARESLPRHGFKEPFQEVDDIIDNASRTASQSDGGTVYIQRAAGRGRSYNIAIVSSENKIVTAMKNLTPHELSNLGRNYGFNPNP